MSLCVAWKYEDAHVSKVGFAADSCVTVLSKKGSFEMPYGGVKVLAIPVKIIPPETNIPDPRAVPFERVFGMAFVDDYLPAFLLKETMAELLQHLQIIGIPSEVRFSQICDFVLKIHKHFHSQLKDHLKQEFEVSFFFGGICPSSGRVRVAKFLVDFDAEKPIYREVLQGSGVQYDVLGQPKAEQRFQQLLELNLSAPPCRVEHAVWRRLREVLLDPTIPFVKGAIQHGEFAADGNFEFCGTIDIEFINGKLRPKMFIRGVDIDEVHQAQSVGDFHIHYSFANPFLEDVRAFAPNHFWNEDGSGVVIDEPTTVVPYERNWPEYYASESNLLLSIFGKKALAVEHIGSTAVPEMPARPVIDILVGIVTVGDQRKPPFELKLNGYDYVGDCGIPDRLVYRKRQKGMFDLHIVAYEGEFWNKSIKLREFLRSHADEAKNYGLEKLRILNAGSWTLMRYLDCRSNYLNRLIMRVT